MLARLAMYQVTGHRDDLAFDLRLSGESQWVQGIGVEEFVIDRVNERLDVPATGRIDQAEEPLAVHIGISALEYFQLFEYVRN